VTKKDKLIMMCLAGSLLPALAVTWYMLTQENHEALFRATAAVALWAAFYNAAYRMFIGPR